VSRRSDELSAQAVAYLYSQGQTQIDIAVLLGISQAVVSRLLARARAEGWIEETVRFARERFSEETLKEIELFSSPHSLQQKITGLVRRGEHYDGGEGPRIRVFPLAGAKDLDRHERLKVFGTAAAGHVRDLLCRSEFTGVSFGNTVAAVVKGLEPICLPHPRSDRPVNFFPLCGEPLGFNPSKQSASILAAQLDEFINGRRDHAFSLAAVPALIPKSFKGADLKVIQRLLGQVESFSLLFRGQDVNGRLREPWISKVDTILTSVSPERFAFWFANDAFVKTYGISREELDELAVGDIGGVLIPRGTLPKSKRAKLEGIRDRWNGVRVEHLQECARKARNGSKPGIVVVATDRDKATFLLHIIRLGLVNQLLIDQTLAEELEQLSG
jgi:DNA-binding transcriptional regulator LsrR (DeoR family)